MKNRNLLVAAILVLVLLLLAAYASTTRTPSANEEYSEYSIGEEELRGAEENDYSADETLIETPAEVAPE